MMLNELIYTRCGVGRDILKNGATQMGEGLKVYSCSEDLFKEGADFPFIKSIVAVRHPFQEPDFMNDAYLYYIPEKGSPLFANFHPIPEAMGRPGNFISQIFSGDLNGYPCEFFGSSDWDAKSKPETYYYGFEKKAPDFLPQRKNLSKGKITFEKAGEFISQGRAEALKASVSFVFQQFAAAPEDRKYLIIKDTTENIELWIAAIEYAFSVKIACSIPFATRMADITATGGTTGNRYVVNASGFSCPVGEEGSKKRLKVIIAGIDLRDKNIANLKSLPAYYCILDGTQKKALFEVPDISAVGYYSVITKFDQEHLELLKVISELKNSSVSNSIFEVWEAYNYLIKTPANSWQTGEAAKHLVYIKKNLNSNYFFRETLYKKIYSNIENFIKQDEASGYKFLDWLRESGGLDENKICDFIIGFFINKLKTGSSGLDASWEEIKKQSFALIVADKILEKPILDLLIEAISKSDKKRVLQILSVYTGCLKIIQRSSPIEKDEIQIAAFSRGIALEDMELLKGPLDELGGNTDRVRNFIFSIAKKIEGDQKQSDFIWRFILDVFAASISETNIRSFCSNAIDLKFPERVEDILVKGLVSGIKPGVLCQIFREAYKDPGDNDGLKFFKWYIEKADSVNSYSQIIDEINASNLHERVCAVLYHLMDKKMPVLVKPRSLEADLERKLKRYAKSDVDCSNAAAGILLCDLVSYVGNKGKINKLLEKNLKDSITVNADFPKTEYCDILIHKIIPTLDMVSQQLTVLCIYQCPDAAFDTFVCLYLDKIVSNGNKNPNLLINLLAISMNINPNEDKPMLENLGKVFGGKLTGIKNKIHKYFPLLIGKYYSEKFISVLRTGVAKCRNENISEELEKHLAKAKAEYEKKRQNSPLGLFKQLFKAKDKGEN
ncbi:MAG: hypothetical protein LBV68_04615 [Spirochaetaceae bacterium]|jgi:hypothetical protein|nr:hypothetical protein [Spirochaetaceae bacterium]